MKNTSLFRRFLSVALVVALLGTLLVPAASAAPDKSAEPTVQELTLTPMDPGELASHKLGRTDAADAIEQADHALTDRVRVSIVLDKASTLDAGFSAEGIADNGLARIYRAGLRASQAAVAARIEKATGSKLDVKWNLTLAVNIISANVLYGQIDTIKAVSGVKDVFLENRYEPQVAEKVDEPNNGSASYMIGSNITWADGYTGAGSKVAVIDTGIDKDHISFSGEGLEYALQQNAEEKGMSYEDYVASLDLLTAEKIDALKDQLNAGISSGADAYLNTKVGFAYNYVDGNFDVIHLNDTQGEHGSHVEGIAAANRFVKVDGEFVPALKSVGTQGVAPDAQIVTMKVFGSGGGAYDSDYMAAIEDALVLGCDSANLSLGSGSAGFSFSNGYENVMNKLVKNGTVVAFSAGNSGGWLDVPYDSENMYPFLYTDDVNYATGGSPGSFTNSLSTASVDNLGKTGMPLIYGDRHVFYSQTSGYSNAPIATIAGKEYEYVLLDSPGVNDNANVGAEGDDFFALGSEVLSGKVAMCYRGSSSFFAKANAAVAQGAIAVVIINNVDGIINMDLTGYEYSAPAVSILKADGDAIKAASEAVTDEEGKVLYYTGTMSVGAEIEVQVPELTDTVTVSSFSSYGPPASMVLKPEILTPGGSIYSVWGANRGESTPTESHEDYEVMSGTSMASPQTAGMAAVLGQYIRDNDLCEKTGLSARQLINSLLMSTAHPVYDEDGNYWPVFRVGAGLGNVGDAVAAKSYILMDEDATLFPDSALDGKVKVELGDDPDWTGEFDFGFTVYPLEGQKEFTLRTDIFTQWIAGNTSYGLLQDTATVLLGSEATYEIDGETYEDTYLLEADVNMDGVTDAADAQAILDHITGAADEEDPFDETVADVDGDGAITTYDAKLLLESAETPVVEIGAPTHVKVHVKISEDDIGFLARYFTKGFYIEGYTYVDPVADKEGAMDVTHSIPILGFCGNWTDPSMLDRSSPIDEAYGTGKLPYLSNSNTNYLSLKEPDGDSVIYMGNPYLVEDKFPADRLAMNSETTIASFNYLNIRNIATLGFALRDEEGKVLFSQAMPTQMFAAYYYVNGGVWQNYNPRNYNVGKKLSAMGVQEGDKVNVGFYGLPEYYGILNAKRNGEVAESGSLDNEGFKAILEAGLVGEGAGINYDVVIDDTAPVVKGALQDLITGDIYVKASDNEYIAYVAVTNKAGNNVFFETVPEQKGPGEEIEVPLELEGVDLPKEVVLLVGDYAGNEVAFKVSLGGNNKEDSFAGQMFGFVPADSTYGPGSGNRVWTIDPAAASVTTSSYTGVENFANVEFNVTAAEYLDGYVFMAADDGWFYAADLEELGEATRMGKYSDTVDQIYDMAYNYANETMYVLGSNNTLYSMDVVSGKLTPAYVLTLPGTYGNSANANRLAIDDNGVAYIGNYGTASTAELFKFQIALPEEGDSGELGELLYSNGFEDDLDGWTFVDADEDGHSWEATFISGYAPYEGEKYLFSASDYSGWSRTPDNWAISPAIDLSGLESATLALQAKNRSSTFADVVRFYAGTSPDVETMQPITEDRVPGTEWEPVVADLSDFVGEETVYVAARHYNTNWCYYVFLDNFEIYGVEAGEPGEEPVIEAVPVEPELVGVMGVPSNYSRGGAFAWDHNENKLYLVSNSTATSSSDHFLWTVDTATGKATKTNLSSNLRASVRGLFIVPGRTPYIEPTDVATELVVEPDTLELLRGETAELKIAVLPWTLTDKDVTFESADPNIASVKNGVVTAENVGETTITVTTVAEPHLTFEVTVIVTLPPNVELRGIVWDENGKGQASVFNSTATADWEALSVVGQLRWGALVGDTVYGSSDDTIYAFDADSYEVTPLGGIASTWIFSDAEELPQDYIDAFADMGYKVGPVIGPNNGGTFLTMMDPEAGTLLYFDFSESFSGDPMALITYSHREDYSYIDWNTFTYVTDPDCVVYYLMTESGALYELLLTHDGSAAPTKIADTGLDLSGVADATNETWGSMEYDEENGFLYVSLYKGGDYANLYAIDLADPTRISCTGDFNEGVWPVTGLYQYDPLTDLTMKVNPEEIELFETQSTELNVKIKLGETNDYTVEVADPTIASYEDGIVTGLKEGETEITVTTVDTNDAGEHLSVTIPVTVKGMLALDLTVKGQVTDEKGARFTSILLDGPTAAARGKEAPFDVKSGARTGDVYLAADETQIVALDPETFEPVDTFNPDPSGYFSEYPAMDIANYPYFINGDGEYVTEKALFTTSVGYLADPSYNYWDMSSVIPDMAAIAFSGTDVDDEGNNLYVYYLLTTAGALYEIDLNYASGSLSYGKLLDTGITVTDPSALSMAIAYDKSFSYSSEEETYGLVIANNEDKTLWFIDFITGEVGLVGTLEADNVSGLIGYFDELVYVDEKPEPQPYLDGDLIAQFDFETEPADWIFYDDDEDGNTWYWNQGVEGFSGIAGYEGTGMLMSASYINNVGALTPDNWAYTPVIDLTDAADDVSLTFFAKGQDSNGYHHEHFAVYVLPEGAEVPTKVMDETEATAKWTQYTVDLGAYAGQKINIAFRHFNTTDEYILDLDYIQVKDNLYWVYPEVYVDPFQAPDAPGLERAKPADGDAIAFTVPAGEVQMTKRGETVNEVVGGTNAAKLGNVTVPKTLVTDETTADEGEVTIVLKEDEAVTNGLITATYDPEILTFVDALSDVELWSVNEKEGVICFAYAAVEEIPAETALATLRFTYNKYEALDTVVTVETLERSGDVAVEEEPLDIELKAEPHVHAYGEPVWNWAEGNESATATFTCEAGDDEQILEATVTVETTPASCTEMGTTLYTATVEFQGETYTDTRAVGIDAPGHTPGEPVEENRKEPTCTETGSYDTVVYCSVCGAELSRETTELPMIAHAYGEPEWNWSEDNLEATAKFVCVNCGDEQIVEAEVEMEVTAPTCTEEGKTAFVATVEFEDEIFTDIVEEAIPAKGHAFGEPEWIWSEDHSEATAKFVCANCGAEELVEAEVSVENTPATCTEEGNNTFTAAAEFEGESYTDVRVVAIDALGHTAGEPVEEGRVEPTCTENGSFDTVVYCTVCGAELSRETTVLEAIGHNYGGAEWTWSDDKMEASAKFTCANCGDVQIVEAEVEMEVTAPTCTEAGKTVFIATAEFEGKNYTTTAEEEIPALGHTAGEPVEENRKEPTCTEAGSFDTVIYCSVCGAELSRETKTIPALGHSFGEPTAWTWNEDHSKATAKIVCSVCGAEEILEAVVSSETTPATDKKEGKIVYTATVEVDGKTYTSTEEVIIPKTEHDCPTNFTDVPAFGTVEHDAIDWAFLKGVTKGTDDTHFEPNRTVTRGEAVTFLWRAAGKPAPKTTSNPFTDVAEGRFYYKAVLWANEMGITKGTTETTFEPNKVCNRAEILTFLYRWAGSPKVNTKTNVPFTDVKAGKFYYKAMLWALENGIDAGISATEFGPTKASPRVEIVLFLYRAMTGEGLVN